MTAKNTNTTPEGAKSEDPKAAKKEAVAAAKASDASDKADQARADNEAHTKVADQPKETLLDAAAQGADPSARPGGLQDEAMTQDEARGPAKSLRTSRYQPKNFSANAKGTNPLHVAIYAKAAELEAEFDKIADGRRQALAYTWLETAVMFAVKE